MKETELISRLASSAAGQPAVETADITDRVMSTIRRTRQESSTHIWFATATASCVIALLASIGAAQSWSSLSNPLTDLSVAHTPSVMP